MDEHLLTLLEAGAQGPGSFRSLPSSIEPRPVADVWRCAGRASSWFAARFPPETGVATILTSSLESLGSLIGGFRAGLRMASLPTPGRAMSLEAYVEQLTAICDLLDPAVLVADPGYEDLLGSLPHRVVNSQTVAAGAPGVAPPDHAGGELVQFTSGSTGRPKGVCLSMEAIGRNVLATQERTGVGTGDACVSWMPLSHDFGLVAMAFVSLAGGLSLTLIDPEHFLRQPQVWLTAASEMRGNYTGTPNFALGLAARKPPSGPLDLRSLRVILIGAERNRGDTLRAFEAAFRPSGLPANALCPSYGMAEAVVGISITPPSEPWRSTWVDPIQLGDGAWVPQEPGHGLELVSAGPCLQGVELRVRPDAPGQVAELEVASTALAERFLGAELELRDGRWLRTADLGCIVDGHACPISRTDSVVIVQGENRFAEDLEAAVSHPLVREGNIAVVAAPTGGYLTVAEPRQESSRDELGSAAAEIRLQQVKTVGSAPSGVVFVARRTLPKTPSGKLRRHAISLGLETGTLEPLARFDFG
jgi:fatty-acyl-CoA synthase